MDNAAVFECLNFQSGVFSTAYLCSPRFAEAKPLDTAKTDGNGAYKVALIPNTLKAASDNYRKTTYKGNQKGKLLRIKMSHWSTATRKTILFPNTPVSLSTFHCGRRGP
jgi:hypothetical protein